MGSKETMAWLKKEVETWKNQRIINEQQAESILKYESYNATESSGTKEEPKDDKQSGVITTISMLGSVLIGIGAILFVASNWSKLPDFIKIILLISMTFGTYYAGWKLKFETKSRPRLGNALLFLASLFVGATIFLTALIFNVNANASSLILLWFLAITPLSYTFNSKAILGLGIFTFLLWIRFYLVTYDSPGLLTLLFLLLGISFYGFGQLHIRFKQYSSFQHIYQSVGIFFILLIYFLFSIFSRYAYNEILTAIDNFIKIITSELAIGLLFALFGVTALASVVYSKPGNTGFKAVKYEFYVLLLAFLGWFGILSLKLLGDSITNTFINSLLFVLFNLLFFVLTISTILIGSYKSIVSFVNIGMLFFIAGVLYLYFTTLYGLLPRSLAFIISGIILLWFGSRLEKKRREIIKNIEG